MHPKRKVIDQKIVDEIVKTLHEMQYGELVITIHDGRLVQIEKKEKKRF